MKNTLALVALAASLGEVTATFRHVKPFTCPDGINNSCFDKQKSGFDFGDLIPGKFDKYNDFDFKGWTCETKSSKKVIKGECGSSKDESPSFGHPENPFSVDHLDVTPEIDTDLEFHYDMPDGSNCKQRSFCSKQGSSIKNSQCGGAKKVTIVYPPNKKHFKNKCKIDIGKIGFGCDKTKFPPPPVVVPPPPPPAPSTLSTVFSSPPVPTLPVETPEVPPPQETKPVETPEIPVESKPIESPEIPQETKPVETPEIPIPPQESSELIPSETLPAPVETPFVPPQESEAVSSPVPVASEPAESLPVESLPVESVPAVSSPVVESTTSEAIPVISEPPVVETTVFQSTSTIFTTSVETVTDCGPEKPECGGQVTDVVVTVTVPLTTTVCDVTETFTRPAIPSETPSEEKPEQPETPETPEQPETPNKPEQPETPNKPEQPETPNKPEQPETPEQPEEELPCDPVVPRCLVTWLPLVPDCKDNTDSKCFCPSKEFIEKVFECVYAHGESDEIIDKAVKFVQGICAEHVPENPAVVTGAESITEVLVIPTATATPEGKYTTITLDTTLTVPCVEDGTTISESSTTTVVRATVEVPEVGFTTTASDIVPVIIPTAVPVQEGEGEGEGEGNNPTLVVAPPTVPVGTGGIPIPSGTGDFPAEAGAGKLTAGVTAAFAVMLAMAAF